MLWIAAIIVWSLLVLSGVLLWLEQRSDSGDGW